MNRLEIIKDNTHIIINENERLGIIASNTIMQDFFLELSGIKVNHYNVLFNNKNVLDNEEYFSKRLLIDFKENTISTLNHHFLKEGLKIRYNLDFDEIIFQKYVNKLKINKECTIDTSYHFTLKGRALANFALTFSVNKEILLINNPTIYQDNKMIIDEIVKDITDKPIDVLNFNNKVKERIIILGLDNIAHFVQQLDKILFINQNYDIFVVDPKNDSLIIIDYFENYKDKAIYTNNGKMILLDNLTKSDYKILMNNKIKDKTVKASKIGPYLQGGNNG